MKFFKELRNKYENFIYEKYEIIEDNDKYIFKYHFNIPNLTWFYPEISIKKEFIINNNISEDHFNYFVFHIGLIELISYYKCTCCPNIIIKCGYLNEEQMEWFKKIYYNGLGEFLYKNNISISLKDFVNIKCEYPKMEIPSIDYSGMGNLICVGGGKDSCVSLEILRNENNCGFMINPRTPSLESCSIAEIPYIFVERKLDRKIIELNNEGFLNGHTPFSSLVAFISSFCCYLQNRKYIILSNESSANQATVLGTNINHQYSKTYEFENDFQEYLKTYFKLDINYFSLLRGLSEFNIGKLFSRYEKYHKIFKSCNLGSKSKDWKWCCECPKCLFVFVILSPFLYKDKLINIFGEDLYTKKELLDTFIELLGFSEVKPFECVGTYEEARYAVSLLIKKLNKDNLPYLLDYYYKNYELELDGKEILQYNEQNNLNEHFENLVKEELMKNV